MKLNNMFENTTDIEIGQLVDDSRVISHQGLYFARKGFKVDGHTFINQAINNGAIAIVHSDDILEKKAGVEYIQVDDVVDALHSAANIFFDYPSHKMRVHGITGTNGKSTTMKTLFNLINSLGGKAGYVGTVSIEYADKVLPPTLSTPDILELYTLYADMVKEGITDVCQEVSSQGLDLRRVDSMKFFDASFTNLSHDHLDYHKSMDEYYAAKHRFFDLIEKDTPRIINIDDTHGAKLAKEAPEYTITYALDSEADYQAVDLVLSANDTKFTLIHNNKHYKVTSNLKARFNVYNALNVIAILHNQGYPLNVILKELESVKGVEGRVNMVEAGQDFLVCVDYAHSPDSTEVVFEYFNSIKEDGKQLISVFGSAGDRDLEKRPISAALATKMCDHVIFTEDDNHMEPLASIIEDLIKGVVSDNYEVVLDRESAIKRAINLANRGDIVVVLGKGQEKNLKRGPRPIPYKGDDTIAFKAIKEKLNETK